MIKEAKARGIKTDKNESNIDALEAICGADLGYSEASLAMASSPHINRINITHRANLYRKDPMYYAEFYIDTMSEYNKPCCDKCLYYWVTHATRSV
jgi:hypothetical protein